VFPHDSKGNFVLRTLPIAQTIRHMLSSTMNNLRFALIAQWPWMLILAVIIGVFGASNAIPFGQPATELEAFFKENPSQIVIFFLGGIVVLLTSFLAFSSVAVAWHRYVLLDEVPQGLAKLRLDGTVWRYFGNLILLSLVVMVVMLPIAVVVVPLTSVSPIIGGIGFLAYLIVVLLPVINRLSIKLPAVALGRTDFRLGDAWAASANNWWQIIAVGFGVVAISWGVGLILELLSRVLATVLGTAIGFWTSLLLQTFVNWVLTIMGITFLTSLYGFFVEKRDF
jgi:hypothetical protein